MTSDSTLTTSELLALFVHLQRARAAGDVSVTARLSHVRSILDGRID